MTIFLKNALKITFSLNTRSLIVSRILLGWICLCDLFIKFNELQFFSPHEGFFPPNYFFNIYQNHNLFFGIFRYSDSQWTFILLFGIGALAALGLIWNQFVKQSLIILWFIMLSLKMQSPITAKAYDQLLVVTLMWFFFFPCKGKLRDLKKEGRNFSDLATLGWFIQILLIYTFTFLYKTSVPEWGQSFTALYFILHKIPVTTPYSHLLVNFTLTKILTFSTLLIEVLVPFIIIFGFRNDKIRIWSAILYIFFHSTIFIFLNVGTFSPLSILLWLSVLPGSFWNFLGSDENNENTISQSKITNGLSAILLVTTLYNNINNFFFHQNFQLQKHTIFYPLSLNQNWFMYTESNHFNPISMWLVSEAQYNDNSRHVWDELNQREVNFDRPKHGEEIIPNYLWQNIFQAIFYNMRARNDSTMTGYLANYLCFKNPTIKEIKLSILSSNFENNLTKKKLILTKQCPSKK